MSYNFEELASVVFANESRITQLEDEQAAFIRNGDYSAFVRYCEDIFGRVAMLQNEIDYLRDYIKKIEPYIPEVPDPADIL